MNAYLNHFVEAQTTNCALFLLLQGFMLCGGPVHSLHDEDLTLNGKAETTVLRLWAAPSAHFKSYEINLQYAICYFLTHTQPSGQRHYFFFFFSAKQLCLLWVAKLWQTHLSNPEEEVGVYSRWHYSLAWRRVAAKESSWWHYSQARNRVAAQERNFITGCFQFS